MNVNKISIFIYQTIAEKEQFALNFFDKYLYNPDNARF